MTDDKNRAAGGICGVLEEALSLFACLRLELIEDVVGRFILERLEDVGAIVRRHLRDELRRLAGRHRLEDFAAQILVEVLEHVGGSSGGQSAQQLGDPLTGQCFRYIREIGGVHLLSLRGNAAGSFVKEIQDVGGEQRGHPPHFVFA